MIAIVPVANELAEEGMGGSGMDFLFNAELRRFLVNRVFSSLEWTHSLLC